MNPSVLFIITTDPRVSARPAEAMRIAAGVGTWKKVDLAVYLRGPAVLALIEQTDELVDEENLVRYLPMAAGLGRPIYVERGAPLLSQPGRAPVRFEEMADDQLARLAAQSNYVVRF